VRVRSSSSLAAEDEDIDDSDVARARVGRRSVSGIPPGNVGSGPDELDVVEAGSAVSVGLMTSDDLTPSTSSSIPRHTAAARSLVTSRIAIAPTRPGYF